VVADAPCLRRFCTDLLQQSEEEVRELATVTQALTSLARMTLRQLRQVASGLGVGQYSRKPKNELTEEISAMQTGDPPEASEGSAVSASLAELEADFSPAPRPGAQTKVVFLPRGSPSGPTYSGRSPTVIVARRCPQEPASFVCGSPTSPAFRRATHTPHPCRRCLSTAMPPSGTSLFR